MNTIVFGYGNIAVRGMVNKKNPIGPDAPARIMFFQLPDRLEVGQQLKHEDVDGLEPILTMEFHSLA